MNVRGGASRDPSLVWRQLDQLRRRLLRGMKAGLPALAALDLTVPESMVLFHLVENGPRCVTDLMPVSGRSQGSTSQLVARLERAGFVGRRRDPSDGRRTVVFARKKAERLAEEVTGLRERAFREAMASVPAPLVQQLEDALAGVLEAMEEEAKS